MILTLLLGSALVLAAPPPAALPHANALSHLPALPPHRPDGPGFLVRAATVLFPCCGINWKYDGLSEIMDKGGEFRSFEHITDSNKNGYKRNPLAESIMHNLPEVTNALLKSRADVKGKMAKSEFRQVYRVEDPIQLLLSDGYTDGIEAFLPSLLRAYASQYSSQFLGRLTRVMEDCLQVSDVCVSIAIQSAKEHKIIFPVQDGIYRWVESAIKNYKDSTLRLIFRDLIGAPSHLEKVKALYENMKYLPLRDRQRLDELQSSIESEKALLKKSAYPWEAKIHQVELRFDPQIQEIESKIERIQERGHIEIVNIQAKMEMVKNAEFFIWQQDTVGAKLERDYIALSKKLQLTQVETLEKIDEAKFRLNPILAEKNEQLEPLKFELGRLKTETELRISEFSTQIKSIEEKQKLDTNEIIQKIQELENPQNFLKDID